MKKWLQIAILSVNQTTHKKCATFFVACSIFFLGAFIVYASTEVVTPTKSSTQTISVSAAVARSPEFSFAIRKNSSVILSKHSFILDEEGSIRVIIKGGNNEGLRNHWVFLRILNIFGQETLSLQGKTDVSGSVNFQMKMDEFSLGSNAVEVQDRTYDAPLILINKPSFVVYEPETGKEKTIKVMKSTNGFSHSHDEEDIRYTLIFVSDRTALKNATINIYQPIETFVRAGPSILPYQ